MGILVDRPIACSLIGPHGEVVDVRLGAPKPFEGSDARVGWACPFWVGNVENIGWRPWVAYGAGVDGVQALTLGLVRVGEYVFICATRQPRRHRF